MSHSVPDGPESSLTSHAASSSSRGSGARNRPPIKTKPVKLRSHRGDGGDNQIGSVSRSDTTKSTQSTESRRARSSEVASSSTSTSGSSMRSMDDDRTIDRSWTPSLMSSSGRSRASSQGTMDGRVGIDENSLADAIVASSLASRHAHLPRKASIPPPVPHPRRKFRSLLNNADNNGTDRSPPSPRITLPQTLRSRGDDDHHDNEDHHHHHGRLHIRKHPHKHHEGARKRWRSEVTESERKRYEGVWAANKGLLLPPASEMRLPPDASNMVVNLVVRDIWMRSGLPTDTLAKIWDLVNGLGIGLLRRDEFVAGMWLVDQQLKGRKLPDRVPQSVWNSVRHAPGIKPPGT